MTQYASPATVKAPFAGEKLEFDGETFELTTRGQQLWVKIEDLPQPGVAPPPPVEVPIGLVTGSHHMQVFWVPTPAGNLQVGFPFAWLIEDQRWVPRNDTFIRDPVPPREIWNTTCLRCHATAGQPRPDPVAGFDTRAAELGIACEACHGPGEKHVQHHAKSQGPRGNLGRDPTIVHPERLDAVRASQICGQCHSMKWFEAKTDWEPEGFAYRPGDDLEKTTPIIRPKNLESQPWLKNILAKNPDLLGDFFWSDGMMRVTGREYNGLLETPCFQRGNLSCLSCHSMHESHPNDQLARGMDTNRACLQCHEGMGKNLTAHTRHSADSSGSLCYNCHMPHTTYGLLKAIRSHQIDSPNAGVTLQTGRPNACNLCHLNQPLQWTADHLNQWYRQPVPSLPQEHQSTAASLLWLLSGDAAQRALVAWSMGWEPARRVSGQAWIPAHLAHLLEDPYAAIRYIAHKSLRQLPGFGDFSYDYIGPPEERARAKEKVLADSKPATFPRGQAERVLFKNEGVPDREKISRLLENRNNRPVHLRE